MKSVLLIGLGRFGKHIAMELKALNHQVMAVDTREERVEEVLPYVTSAQIGDSTNEEFLSSLGVRNFDVCIVAIGNDFQSSLETTSLLDVYKRQVKNGPNEGESLAPVAERLSEKLGKPVVFVSDYNVTGEAATSAVAAMQEGDVVLLQNTRFRGSEETKNCLLYTSCSAIIKIN